MYKELKITKQMYDAFVGGAKVNNEFQCKLMEIVSPHLELERGQTINPDMCISWLEDNLKIKS